MSSGRLMAGMLLLAAGLVVASQQPSHACKSAGSFFDYRNCVPAPARLPEELTSAVRQEAEPPAAPVRSQGDQPAAGIETPVRIRVKPNDAAPPARSAARPPAAAPAPKGGTRLVDIADGAGRKITLGCVRGDAVVYIEVAAPMSDKGSRKEVYFTLDGGEPQILELEKAKKQSVQEAGGLVDDTAWETYHSGTSVTLEHELAKSGHVMAAHRLNTGIVRSFHTMFLASVSG